jgi:hypothetical protein
MENGGGGGGGGQEKKAAGREREVKGRKGVKPENCHRVTGPGALSFP